MTQEPVRTNEITVIDLSRAPGERSAWDRPKLYIYAWSIAEILFVTNPWQISSGLRCRVLRLFGAKIGAGVVFRPRTRVKFPWKLEIGDRSWIGEGVWFHNQDRISIGHDVVISQETFLTTGSHAIRKDMSLITKPIQIDSGVWITSRCIVLGGTNVGTSSVIGPGSIIQGNIKPNQVLNTSKTVESKQRFKL